MHVVVSKKVFYSRIFSEKYPVEFPDEALSAVLSGMNITDVASDDLQYFTNLYSIDMSDNEVIYKD